MQKITAMLFVLALTGLSGTVSMAQVSRASHNKSVVYRANYQRMASGCTSQASFEIRNGSLWAWGYNGSGQLGDGTTVTKYSPVQIGSNTKWVSIACGEGHTLGIQSDGTLWAWGRNNEGELGDGTNTDKNNPVQIGSDRWISISCGEYYTIGLKSDGSLWAWGNNHYGQLGDGTNTDKNIPVQIGSDTWIRITCGYLNTIGIKSNGTLWAWGYNAYGQLGDGTMTDKSSPVQIGSDNKWTGIACGYTHSMGLRSDGSLWAWGDNSFGQLGDGTNTGQHSPVQIGSDNAWISITCCQVSTMGLKSDGSLWAWGFNRQGELGDGTTTNKNSPIQIGSDTWVSIACGSFHTMGLKSNGTLWAWGANNLGSLGDGSTTNISIPEQIRGAPGEWVSMASGGSHTLSIKADGTLWAWGYNNAGQLGDGTNTNKFIPVQIGPDNKWVSIACGQYHTLAIKADGTLWAWGDNYWGELGDGTNANKNSPIKIGSDNRWVSVACGGNCSMGLKSDGSLWAWGSDFAGQLGNGTTTNQNSPIQIGSDTKWVSIACGGSHTIGLKADGTLWAWGDNYWGQLGDGTGLGKSNPVQIGSDSKWISIACGNAHSMGLKSDGSLWAWGYNSQGQLGDGTNTIKYSPVQVGSDTWLRIVCGDSHTLGLHTNGSLWAWGANFNGQLGDGSNVNKNIPVQNNDQSNVLAVVCGGNNSGIIKSERDYICMTGYNTAGQLGNGTTGSTNVFGCSITTAPPSITTFSPEDGPVGTLVTITGTNLRNPSAFTLGGISAIAVSNDGTTLAGMVMPGATTGAVSVTTTGGTATGGGNFTVTPTPFPSAQQESKLVGTGAIGAAAQGQTVAVSADGNTAIVGGSYDNNFAGAVWIYKRSNGVWTQQGNKLVGSGATGVASQGCAVSLSADGNTVMVGGISDNSGAGAVWVFTRSVGVWSQQGSKLVGSGALGNAGQGVSVSLSADGNTAIVGGYQDNSLAGAVWIYTRSGGVWTQQGNKLVGTGAFGKAVQGQSVSISADGNTALAGGYNDNGSTGAAWVYTRSGGVWTQQGGKLVGSVSTGNPQQGFSVSLSADGNTAMVGGPNDNTDWGAAWVFIRNAGSWSQQGNKMVAIGSAGAAQQGWSVSLSADGNSALVGGLSDNGGAGAAWVYTRSAGVWSQQLNTLVGNDATGAARQGFSVSLSADGNTALVGGPNDNSQSGAAWAFIHTDCANPADAGTIAGDQSGCSPYYPTEITGTIPTGQTGTLEYQWKISTDNNIFGSIEGATSANYDPPAGITADTWYKRFVKVTCESVWNESAAVKMTVNPPTAGGAVTGGGMVCYGSSSTVLTLSGHTGGVQRWEWSPNGMDWHIIANNAETYTATDLVANTWFRAVVKSGECPEENSTPAGITVFSDYHISGYARYANNPKTPLNGLKITLRQGGVAVRPSYTTGTTGFYEFTGLTNGTYDLEVATAHPGGQWQTWNGVNNTDYLLAAMHVAGTLLLPENPPVVRVAANVKAPLTTGITTADADVIRLAAKYGWGSPLPYFDISKWVFSGTTGSTGLAGVVLSCGNVSRDIMGLCAGDLNGSYLPPNGMKDATPGLTLLNRGEIALGPEITFPVKAETDMEIGAITLMLDFDASLLEITGVDMPDQGDAAPYFFVTRHAPPVTPGVLNIGWMSLSPVSIPAGETVLSIHARISNIEQRISNFEGQIRFTLNEDPLSELADGEGNVLGNAKLTIAGAGHSSTFTRHENLVSVFPNPASDVLNIEYQMDSDGMFSAELMSVQGVVLMRTGNTDSKAGLNKTRMNLQDFPGGAYLLKVVCGENQETVKVMVNR